MPASQDAEWKYWDEKATEIRRTQLATVQAAAAKWSALLTALLGVFGTVAFAGGLTTVDKLADPWDIVVKVVTSLAALCAVLGIVFLSLAAGGLGIERLPAISATAVRRLFTSNAQEALERLDTGKKWAIRAAVLVLAGSLLVLWVGEAQEETKPSSVVAVVNERLVCGPLGSGTNDGLTIGGLAADGATLVVPVTACPKAAS